MFRHDFVTCGVSDPKPTCGVITSPPIRGQNVTLSCSMTYLHRTGALVLAGASLSGSISWDSAAGTFLSTSSNPVYNINAQRIGETLQVDVMTLASGAEIPSYNCTSSFHFIQHQVPFTVALNNVTWTCVSAPVITCCM